MTHFEKQLCSIDPHRTTILYPWPLGSNNLSSKSTLNDLPAFLAHYEQPPSTQDPVNNHALKTPRTIIQRLTMQLEQTLFTQDQP